MPTETKPVTDRRVAMSLAGLDGNAFALLGAFHRAARKAEWPQDEIETVLELAKSGDYDNLVATINAYCVRSSERMGHYRIRGSGHIHELEASSLV